MTILFALWFFLPAGVANSAPIFASKIPFLKKYTRPVDSGKTFRGHPVLGKNKTWRGFASGVITAIIVVYIQQLVWQAGWVDNLNSQPMEYLAYSPVLLGFLFGFGALFGDAVKSFAKRQFNYESGSAWFPFDQIDYILGACLFMAPIVVLSAETYLLVLIVWFVLHLLFSYLGYLTKFKKQPI